MYDREYHVPLSDTEIHFLNVNFDITRICMLKWHHLNNKKKSLILLNLHVYIQNGSTYVIQLILYYGLPQ